MAKSLSIISGIAALLLFQQHSALQAEPAPWERITWTVTKSGWMNLRKMRSNVSELTGDHWYVCGQRKTIAFWRIINPNDDEYYDYPGQQLETDKEFIGPRRLVARADRFTKDPKFLASASTACAAPASYEPPPWMNLIETPDGVHYYLLPRDFLVNGPIRTFWVSGHPAREVKRRSKIRNDGKPLVPTFGVDKEWFVSYKRESIRRVEIDCQSAQSRTLYRTQYDASMNIIESITRPTEIEYIAPDTIADAWREVVCLIK